MRLFFLAMLLSVSLATTLFDQGDRGTVTGTVSDSQGAIIPNAIIQLRNADTGSTFQTVTTETGNYTLPNLPIGNYELAVELAGFKRYTQQGIPQFGNIDVQYAPLGNPDSGNAAATQQVTNGRIVSGFGRIATNAVAQPPRFGQIVARFQF